MTAADVRRLAAVPIWLTTGALVAFTGFRLSGLGTSFPFIQLLAFTPYALIPLVGVALVAGLLRRWIALAVAVLTLITLAGTVIPRVVGGPRDSTEPTLALLSANMRLGQADPANLVALVRQHHVDVLALQEYTAHAQQALHNAGLDDLLPNRVAYPVPGATGSAIYSRLPLTNGGYRPLPPFFGQAYATVTMPALPGQTGPWYLDIESAHPAAPSDASRSADWCTGLSAEPPGIDNGPFGPGGQVARVLIGDFNSTLDHAPLRQLLARGRYHDAAETLGQGLTPTWPYDGKPVPGVTLDHVLVYDGIPVLRYAVYANPGSDHRAIFAVIGSPAR